MMENSISISLRALRFLRENMIGITELKRSNRLNEILRAYHGGSTEMFVVHSNKQEGKAVIVNLAYFERLLEDQLFLNSIMNNRSIEADGTEVFKIRFDDPKREELDQTLRRIIKQREASGLPFI